MGDYNGLLVIDKPPGITSRDAVDRAQGWFPRKTPIGHTGTLDPLATGILVLCIGNATRLAEYVQLMPKVYRAGIVLGATSDTDDADGLLTPTTGAEPPTRDKVQQELSAFIGKIEQVPPNFSAAKVEGRRAYALARKGQDVKLAPRTVTIHRIDIEYYASPRLDITVRCGKGTYIRALARDLGESLKCGGYIASLRRLEIGGFTEKDAISLDSDGETARRRLLPAWRAVQTWNPIIISAEEAGHLRQGRRIPSALDDILGMAVVDDAGRTVAIVEIKDGWLRPIKVFGNIL